MNGLLSVFTFAMVLGLGFMAGQRHSTQSAEATPTPAPTSTPAPNTEPPPAPVSTQHDELGPLSPSYKPMRPPPSPAPLTTAEMARATYRGFYRTQDGKFRRAQFHCGETEQAFTLEIASNKMQIWRSELGDLNMQSAGEKFQLQMPGRSVELEYKNAHPVPGLEGQYRSMAGVLIDPTGAALEVVMIEAFTPELESIQHKNEYIWPVLGAIQSLMIGEKRQPARDQ